MKTLTTITVSVALAITPLTVVAESSTHATNWNGAFVGVEIGLNSGNSGFVFNNTATSDHSISGGAPSIYGGYDLRYGQNVFGLDASYHFAGPNGETSCPNPSFTCYSEVENFGAIRARYGRVLNTDVLIYGAAGFAFASVVADADPGTGPVFEDPNGNLQGWTVALGAQKMLESGWALRGEFAYTDYDTSRLDDIIADDGNSLELDVQFSTISIGLERRF